MAATMIITCPKCKKQLKGSEAFLGKNVRCKSCAHRFVVESAGSPNAPAAGSPSKSTAPVEKSMYDFDPGSGAKAKSGYSKSEPKPESLHAPMKVSAGPGDSASGIPYSIRAADDIAPRCPQCAHDFESREQVICLQCGYNRQTNRRLITVKTIETSSTERFTWLLPGFVCAGVVFVCLILVGLLWFAISRFDTDGTESGWVFPLQIWGSIICAFISWYCGRFAFKRLVKNPVPPENVKH
jgi:hypothetical protein